MSFHVLQFLRIQTGNLNCSHYVRPCPSMPTKHHPPSFHEFPSFLMILGCHMLSYNWHSGLSSTRNTTQTGSLSATMFVVTAIVAPGFVFCEPTGLKVARETASFLCLQRLLPILIGLLTAAAAVVVLSSVMQHGLF